MDMSRLPSIVLIVAALAMGLFLTIKPEKAVWFGAPDKKRVLIARILGIVILALFAFAAFALFMAWREGQISF